MQCVSPRFASARQNQLPPRIVSAAGESKYSTFLLPRRTSARSPIADIVAGGSVSPAGTRHARHCRTSSSAPTPSSWAGRWLPQMQADSRPISPRCSCGSPEFPAGDRRRGGDPLGLDAQPGPADPVATGEFVSERESIGAARTEPRARSWVISPGTPVFGPPQVSDNCSGPFLRK